MDFIDQPKTVSGLFSLKVLDRAGKILEEQTDNNLVVISGRTSMARLLATADTNRTITKIAFGTGINNEDESLSALQSPYVKALEGFEYPSSTSVKFNWTLGFGEHNGNVITNYALYSDNNTMFSMKVRPSITKDEFISLVGEWTILL